MGFKLSMGKAADRFDHATTESYWSVYTNEYYYWHAFASREELIEGTVGFIRHHNITRRYSKIGHISPLDYEIGCHHPVAQAA